MLRVWKGKMIPKRYELNIASFLFWFGLTLLNFWIYDYLTEFRFESIIAMTCISLVLIITFYNRGSAK